MIYYTHGYLNMSAAKGKGRADTKQTFSKGSTFNGYDDIFTQVDAYYGRYKYKNHLDESHKRYVYILSKNVIRYPKDIPLYMALIIADERVSEALTIPMCFMLLPQD